MHGFIKKTQKTPDEDLVLARKRKKEFESQEIDMTTKKKKRTARRSPASLSALDDLLKQDGKLEEFEAVAIKEVLAWQLGEAMRVGN